MQKSNNHIPCKHSFYVDFQTSRRRSYLALAPSWSTSSLSPFPVVREGGFSIIDVRQFSTSSSSSSLVYPFFCTANDALLDNGEFFPISETFSATSEEEGGTYTIGAAHTSAFSASSTAPETGSGQNSSGVKLQSTRLTNGRLIDGHTYKERYTITHEYFLHKV
ncbi:hypothetical protein ACJIZ3_005748 [Penstemon smallii]|uniref:Uncharacterized protein n=1 Tax=Penstemon smallii TaxID=265156 RepID=A0ABD3S5V2_9LAMI